ncbi:MAG: AAA family ATPase [bacterium]|nr:AAA family ATPase [bacterium]
MEKIFIKKIEIERVRHLKDEEICLGNGDMRHLILTGKNGSGKTSLLDRLSVFLDSITKHDGIMYYQNKVESYQSNYNTGLKQSPDLEDVGERKEFLEAAQNELKAAKSGLDIEFNVSYATLNKNFKNGDFIVAYYKDERVLDLIEPKHVTKVEFQETYGMEDTPSKEFIKYLLDIKMTQALALQAGKSEKGKRITEWFDNFEKILQEMYGEDSIKLEFDEDTFHFYVLQQGRERFGLNEMSRGYAAIMDIIVDLMMRMERHTEQKFSYDMPGVVLIDEIETHLHLELQKRIMGMLTTLFPNIQFIVSTHSPFVLNSISNVTIYDMEKKITIKDGLQNIPYDGIVESYFNVDKLSAELREKFEKYKKLTDKKKLTNDDFAQIAELDLYLSEIPDYLALDITNEFLRRKIAFERREDV